MMTRESRTDDRPVQIDSAAAPAIWITGAARGIGAALARHYAAPGVALGLCDLIGDRLEAVAAECRANGARVQAFVFDVCDRDAAAAAIATFLKTTPTVSLVIANAGVRFEEDRDFASPGVVDLNMGANYFGVINTIVPFLDTLKHQRNGQIAVVSSIGALRGTPNSGAYSASKAAINMWCESTRLRLRAYHVPVTVLCVGFVATDMTRDITFWMPGLLSPDKAARLMARAIRARRRMVVMPWQSRLIFGSLRLFPGFLYDALILWAARLMPRPRRGSGRR